MDGGSGWNSRQHSQVAGIGRAPMTSRGITAHLRKQLQCRLKVFRQGGTHSVHCHGKREHCSVESRGMTRAGAEPAAGLTEMGPSDAPPASSELSIRDFLN